MKHVVRVIAHWALLAHVYISSAGFTLALLFGATGFTLNHPTFGLGRPQVTTSEVTLDKNLINTEDEFAIEDSLRKALGIRLPPTDYHDDAGQIQVTFAGPGARTVVTIDKAESTAHVESENRGFLGKLADLHKGADTGTVWSWTIDVAAILLVVSSLTGMITLVALRARRRTGFAVCLLGVLSVLLIYVVWVPR
jgi:hypothetical protein